MANSELDVQSDLKQESQIEPSKGEKFWRMQYEHLKIDYDHLQKLNQKLEEKLLNLVEVFNKKKDEIIATVEYEKSTLMADVNKLSTKLVDARIRLHDYEEKEMLHAAECSSPCHRGVATCQQHGIEVPILSVINRNQAEIDNNARQASLKTRSTSGPNQTASSNDHQQMFNDPNLV